MYVPFFLQKFFSICRRFPCFFSGDNLEFAVPVAASALLSLQYLVCGAEEYSSGNARAMFAPRGHIALAGTSDAARQFVQSVVEPALIDAMLLAYAASTDTRASPASLQLPPAVQSALGGRLGLGSGSQRRRLACDDRHGHPHPPRFNVTEYIRTDMVKQFASPADMDAYIQAPAYGNDDAHRGLMYGIIVSGVAPAWNYTLRTNWTALADTSWQTNDLQASLDVGDFFTFFSSGAATFQFVLDQAILAVSGVELDLENAATKFIPFPLPAHRVDPFASYVSDVFGLLFLFAYLYVQCRMNSCRARARRLFSSHLFLCVLPFSACHIPGGPFPASCAPWSTRKRRVCARA